MSIENPTLAHFRHFSSLLTNFPSTSVESALQNHLFMQNEPNFGKDQMDVSKVLTKDYGNKPNWTLGENEPKTNPIKPNLSWRSLWRSRIKANFKRGKIQWLAKLLLGGYNYYRIKGSLF